MTVLSTVVVVYVDEIGVSSLIFVVKDSMFPIAGCSVVFSNEVGITVLYSSVDTSVPLFVWEMSAVGPMVVFIEVSYFSEVDSSDSMVKSVDVDILDVNIVVSSANCVDVSEWVTG